MSTQIQTYAEPLPTAWQPGHFQPVPESSEYAMVELELFNRPPSWQTEVDEQLAELMMLPKGWDGPNSGPVSLNMVTFIRAVLKSVMRAGTPLPAFVPGNGGAVQLEWHQNGLDIELMIYRPLDTELSVHFHEGRPPIEDRPLSINFEVLSQVLGELD